MHYKLKRIVSFILVLSLALPCAIGSKEATIQVKASTHKYQCTECGQYFDTNVDSHTRREYYYRCTSCGNRFPYEGTHNITTVTGYHCSSCGGSWSSPPGSHSIEHLSGYTCSSCGKSFSSYTSSHSTTTSLGYNICDTCGANIGSSTSHFVSTCNNCGSSSGIHSYYYYSCRDCRTTLGYIDSVCGTGNVEGSSSKCYKCGSTNIGTTEKYHCNACGGYPAYIDSVCHMSATPATTTKQCSGTLSPNYSYTPCYGSAQPEYTETTCNGPYEQDYTYNTCTGTLKRLSSNITFSHYNIGSANKTIQDIESGSDISSYLSSNTDSASGWTFVGWNTNKSAKSALTSYTLNDDTTFYSIFKKDIPIVYHMRDAGGTASDVQKSKTVYGDGATVSFTVGEGVTTVAPEGYSLYGWSKNTSGITLVGANDNRVNGNSSTVNLYAVYRKAVNVKLKVGAEEKTASGYAYINSGDSTSSIHVTLPPLTKTGYTFGGWKNTTTGTVSAAGSEVVISEGTEFEAVTTPINYTVHVYSNTSSSDNNYLTKALKYDEEGVLPYDGFSKTGYTLKGFSDTRTGTVKYALDTPVKNLSSVDGSTANVYSVWEANKYNLNFDAVDGSCDTPSKKVAYDSAYGELPSASKKGYTFDGWFTQEVGGTKIEPTDIMSETSDKTVYAHYTINKYELTYDTNGGSAVTPNKISLDYDTEYGTLPETTRFGYTFKGWYTEQTRGTQVSESTKISDSNVTIYAHWDANKYNVSFDTNGGNETFDTIQVAFDSKLGTLPTPTKKGHEFKGWYSGDTLVDKDTVLTVEGLSLKAKWEIKSYSLNYETNCATPIPSKTVVYDTKIGDLRTDLTKKGHTFVRWEDSEGNEVTPDTRISDSDMTVYVKWSKNKYTVSFNTNGGIESYADKEYYFDDAYSDLPTPTKKGHTFLGWFTELDGGTKVNAQTKQDDSSLTLYAHWEINKYSLNYNTGYDCIISSKLLVYDTEYGELPSLVRTGYTFDGWYDKEQDGTKVTENTKISDKDAIIYAHWNVNYYDLSFVSNTTENTFDKKSLAYLSKYGELPVPTKKGYTFEGWFDSNEDDANKVTKDSIIGADNVTIYGHWSINSYKLKFNFDGGSGSAEDRTLVYDTPYGELPETEKRGHTFKGWYDSKGNKASSDTKISDSNVTLKAKWQVNSYKITFDSDGGSSVNAKNVDFGSTYGSLDTPSKFGYIFDGWFNGNTKVNSSTVMEDSNVNLRAKWKITEWYKFQKQYEGVISKKDEDCTLSELKSMLESYDRLSEKDKNSLSIEITKSIESKRIRYEYLKFKDTNKVAFEKPVSDLTDAELKSLIDDYNKLSPEAKDLLTDAEKKVIKDAQYLYDYKEFKKSVGDKLTGDVTSLPKEEIEDILNRYENLTGGAKDLFTDEEISGVLLLKTYFEYLEFIENYSDVFSNPVSGIQVDRLNSFINAYNSLSDDAKKYLTSQEKAKIEDVLNYLESIRFSENGGIANKDIGSLTEDELKKILDDYNKLPDEAKDYLGSDVKDAIDDIKDRYDALQFENNNKGASTIDEMKEILDKYDKLPNNIKEWISEDYKKYIEEIRDKVSASEFEKANPCKEDKEYMRELIKKYDALTDGVKKWISKTYKDTLEKWRATIASADFLEKYGSLIDQLVNGNAGSVSVDKLKKFVAEYDKLGVKAKSQIKLDSNSNIESAVETALTIIKDNEVPLTGKILKLKIKKVKYQKGKKRYKITLSTNIKSNKFRIGLGKNKKKVLKKKYYTKTLKKSYKSIVKGKYKNKIKGIKITKLKKGKRYIYISKKLVKKYKYFKISNYKLRGKTIKIIKSSGKRKFKK